MILTLRRTHRRSLFALAAGVACTGTVLGGCTSGARERTMQAREAIVPAGQGSTAIAYFSVHEDLPRTSVAAPITATASSEWLHDR
jgi:hypothetical protein